MNLHLLFQWHKLLHLILPIIAIVALHKRLGLAKICLVMFILGSLKELYDMLVGGYPLWESLMDTGLNGIGIVLGIIFSGW
ncbi:MAG: hypothetical protein P4L69_09720 [Desulfosporosinus sp.]|nr:hypothetical protein [Desulfosporosinus sp.]